MIQKLLHQVVAQELAPEDGTEMYFIFVEQLVLCKAQSLERAGYLFLIWNTLKRFAYLFYLACPTMPSQKPLTFSHSHTHTALVMNYVVTVLYCYERFIDSTFKFGFGEACMLRNGLLKLASIPYILK